MNSDLKLDVEFANIEIGETYPVYGMITKFISEDQPLIIMINNNIEGKCFLLDNEKVKLLKERAFEAGIFVTEITDFREDDGVYLGEIKTIIFGKKQEMVEN